MHQKVVWKKKKMNIRHARYTAELKEIKHLDYSSMDIYITLDFNANNDSQWKGKGKKRRELRILFTSKYPPGQMVQGTIQVNLEARVHNQENWHCTPENEKRSTIKLFKGIKQIIFEVAVDWFNTGITLEGK